MRKPYAPYPKMLYQLGNQYEIDGEWFSTKTVKDYAEQEKAEMDGWHTSTADALNPPTQEPEQEEIQDPQPEPEQLNTEPAFEHEIIEPEQPEIIEPQPEPTPEPEQEEIQDPQPEPMEYIEPEQKEEKKNKPPKSSSRKRK